MINDRYKIKKKLGTGRSQVFLCSDSRNLTKLFAIKVLTNINDEKEIKSFRDEYYLLKKINHPNIVRVYEYGTVLSVDNDDIQDAEINIDSKFFILDYIKGETLDVFKNNIDVNVIKEVVEQICSVLYYLHQSNYVYYNLTPDNILVQKLKDKLHIVFFDFGITKYIPNNEPFEVQGTPNYIAPEILQLSFVDHRSDLYSFGIMLYYLTYGCFPFDTGNELKIYKAIIEHDFEYPDKPGFEEIITVIKNLLFKNPELRYNTSLQILKELNIPITDTMKNCWTPIKVFCGRGKFTFDINTIIFKKINNEVICIRGQEGSGKSFFLEEISYNHSNSILIKNSDIISPDNLWNVLLNKVLYTEFIFKNIDNNLKNEIKSLLFNDSNDLTEKLKSIFLRITRNNKFILLLDDFNKFDDFNIELLKEIIPILQAADIKLVISETEEKPILSDFIFNTKTFYLLPFSNEELYGCLEKSFFNMFPKEELKNIIKTKSDLLPGNIFSVIRNLVYLDIIKYDYNGVFLLKNIEILKLLENNQDEFYQLQFDRLTNEEIKIINLISLFEINLSSKLISLLTGLSDEDTLRIISVLINKGVLHNSSVNINPVITSIGLKKYIYAKINAKEELHNLVGEKLLKIIPGFSRVECARQLELSGEYFKCYEVLKDELEFAEAKSIFPYQKKLLQKLVNFSLENNILNEIKFSLSNVLLHLSEFENCLNLTDELLELNINQIKQTDLLIQKGKCLIKLKNYSEGIDLLKSAASQINDLSLKHKIYIEIAEAELELNNFSAVIPICMNVIEEKKILDSTKAKAYSIMAIVEIRKNNNLAGAVYNFQYALNIFGSSNHSSNVADMQLSIGNVIAMKGNLIEAEKHWQKSYNLNELIGNLAFEAKILLNFGSFHYKMLSFENAIQNYRRAKNIFKFLGNKSGQGLALRNLGEVSLNICEYDSALLQLQKARNIFIELNDKELEAEVLFLFGQCYFYLGDTENLNIYLEQYGNSFIQNNLSERHNYNISYLKVLSDFINKKFEKVIDQIEPLINYYKSRNEKESEFYFAKCVVILIKSLINLKIFDSAKNRLNENEYLSVCEINNVLKAEREFLLGIVSEENNEIKPNSSIEYFNKAMLLIEKQCIMELTWEINFSIAKHYFNQGNYKRFSEYSLITKSLINFISSKINSKSRRLIYNNYIDRKLVVDTLENFEKKI